MEDDRIYEPDETFAAPELLRQCAAQYGTPVLVYSSQVLRERHAMIQNAFSWNTGFSQYFPVSVADELGLLRLICQDGGGLVCSSRLQLLLAKKAGARSNQILFRTVFPMEQDVRTARELDCLEIVNSLEQIQLYRENGWLPRRMGLRFRPDGNFSLRGRLRVNTMPSRFGMTREEILTAAELLAREPIEELGLYMQLSNNETASGYLASVSQALLELLPEVEQRAGREISWCDIGGGLAVPNRKRPEINLNQEAEMVHEAFQAFGREDLELHTQFGRFVAGPAGVLLSRVQGTRSGQRNILGVDASLADLPRPAMTGVDYHISLLGNSSLSGRQTYYVEGPTMEKMDRYGHQHILPESGLGDILVFHDAGAFTRSMASNHGGNLRCPVVLLEGERIQLIRRRETDEDYFRLYSE